MKKKLKDAHDSLGVKTKKCLLDDDGNLKKKTKKKK